jgi:beta-glucanase (GH16 family)
MRARAGRAAMLSLVLLPAGAAMADWQLQHDIDFARVHALDAALWSVETGFRRNQESQYYAGANITLEPGFLRIEARREQVPNAAYRAGARGWRNKSPQAQYTSGSLTSQPTFLYGRFEIVARSPGGAGVWPAIWLLHESRGQYGEIDMHESVGKHPDTVFAGVHYGRTPSTREHRNASRVVPGFEGSWHTHAVEWTPERIVVSLDGQPLMEFDPRAAAGDGIDPLRRPMRLRINLALGGTWGGPIADSRLPAHFDIAAIRIWRWQPGAVEEARPVTPAPIEEATALAPRWGR